MKKKLKIINQEQGLKVLKANKPHSAVIVYPNTYFIGMSNIGFQHIYALINSHPEFYADRAFLTKESQLLTLESEKPLKYFEIIFFSISYEMDYLNLVKILIQAGIPPECKDREHGYPLIVIGGACTFFNPEPIADFADFFVIGEAENALQEVLDKYVSAEYENKNAYLHAIVNIPGIYIPQFYHFNFNQEGKIKNITHEDFAPAKVIRQHVKCLSLYPAYSHIISPDTEFKNMLLCEISRGCAMQCKFCMVKSVYGNLRHQDKNIILKIAKKYRTYTDKIGLVAPTVTTYPDLIELCDNLLLMDYKISFSSLRMEHLNSEIIDILIKSGQKTITIAPEAGSDKLRKYIGKNITLEIILKTVGMIAKSKILNLKIYLMIGLPEETMEDIDAMKDLVENIRDCYIENSSAKGEIGKLIISINPFIPKPFTQFQHCLLEDIIKLKEKYKYLQKKIRPLANTELNFENLNYCELHAFLSQGDRRFSEVLLKIEQGMSWKKALSYSNISDKTIYHTKDKHDILTWDIINERTDK
ncbi:radical SAM protein [Candidatus Poribacteria bacterium]|nr:radical SAM protein [Candidatus Poribacteria bacterium]